VQIGAFTMRIEQGDQRAIRQIRILNPGKATDAISA
jgi:hypothetical protein